MTANSLFVLAAILLSLAAFIWRAQASSGVNRTFAAYTASLAAWTIGIGGLQTGTHLDLWGRFTFAGASLIPTTFLAFTRCYPTISPWPSLRLTRFVLWTGLLLAAASLGSRFIIYDVILTSTGITRRTGSLYTPFSVYFLVVWVAGLSVFAFKWWHARGLARAQLQHLGLGLVVSGFGGIGSNLLLPILTGRSTYSWLGPYFTLALVILVAHAIIRHRLMDLRLIIHRGLTYLLSVAVIAACAVLMMRQVLAASKLPAFPSYHDVVVIGFAFLVFLTTWGQRLIAAVFDRYLYRGRIDHTMALHKATHRLSHLMPKAELAETLRQITSDNFVPESFRIAIRSSSVNSFECVQDWSLSTTGRDQHEWINRLEAAIAGCSGPSLIVLDPLHATPDNGVYDILRVAEAEVAMILGRRDAVLGVILLGPRRSGDAYFTDDLRFLDSLTELASIALDNSMLYQQRLEMLEYSDRLLESLDSGVVAVDIHGHITSINPAGKTLFNVSEDPRGLGLETLPADVGWALALTLKSVGVIAEAETVVEHRERGALPLILSTAVLHDDENRISGALAVATDISAVKALERNQRRVERFATMARFYAGLAHEIRSPLASISNIISMLPDRFDDAEYRDAAARLLPSEVARIVRLAERVRSMAPSEHGELKAIELHSLFLDIITLHTATAATLNIDIRLDCSPDLPRIKGDPSQLVQLFTNLLNNAFEAMPEGGVVTIEVSADYSTSRAVRVHVIDEGIGIPADAQSRIFEPFFTTKSSGTGLGLSICREIADFHHARLSLGLGRNGKGTSVELAFPAAEDDTTSVLAFDSYAVNL